MSQTLSIRVSDELKSKVQPILSSYGLTTSQAVKLFLNQIVETRRVPLSFDYNDYQPNEKTRLSLLQAMNELDNDKSNEIHAESNK